VNTPYVGAILELSTIPIEEKISARVDSLVREICCRNNHCCDGEKLCGVARHDYKMLWVKEWTDYARTN
jgi:hypothetical protein